MWINRATTADEWLLYDTALVSSDGGRSVLEGSVIDTRGRLVATFVQQAMRRGARPGPVVG